MAGMRTLKRGMKWLLGIFFVAAGSNHFFRPDFYVRIMPPYLPCHLGIVYLSGVFEVALGALLLFPKTTKFAAWGLIALLIAVFPANVHMALYPSLYPEFSPTVLWSRLPLQGVMIAWAYWFTGDK
jgi:uncharacterized membrane protein